jgi:hypothetical protein
MIKDIMFWPIQPKNLKASFKKAKKVSHMKWVSTLRSFLKITVWEVTLGFRSLSKHGATN